MKKMKKCEINNCNKNMVLVAGVDVPPFCEYHNGKFFEYSANNFLNLKSNSLKIMEKNKDFQQVFILEQINNFKKLYENKDKKVDWQPFLGQFLYRHLFSKSNWR